MNKQEIEKAIAYWKEFKDEIKELREQYQELEWDEQEKYTDMAIHALKQQLNNGWIPTKSKYDNPIINGEYQVTVRCSNFAGIYDYVTMARFNGMKWDIYGPQPYVYDKKIVAWKPFDKAYKEVPDD